jgi:hypothetical protein
VIPDEPTCSNRSPIPEPAVPLQRLGLIAKAVSAILRRASPTIVPMVERGSKWVVIRCASLENKNQLLSVKIIWFKDAKLHVIFRRIRLAPYLTKFIQRLG